MYGTIVLRSTELTADGAWRIDSPALRAIAPRDARAKALEEGDLVVTTSSGSRDHIGKTGLVTQRISSSGAVFSNFMQRLRLLPGHEPRYFFYLLNSAYGRGQLWALGSTTTGLVNLNGSVIGDLLFPGPPGPSQRAIVGFLDRKTAAIDALIERKERLLALLAEKRAALIHHVVTKGLDPTVPMKDSGVPWIGQIPAHWEIKRLKHLVPARRRVMYGIVLPGPHVDGGVPIVKAGNCKPGQLVLDKLKRTSRDVEARYARSRLRPGDVVYSIRGSYGAAEVVPPELDGANLTQDAARIAPGPRTTPRWMLYMARSAVFLGYLAPRVVGATVRGINIWDLERTLVPLPPPSEQGELARRLQSESGSLRRTSSVVNAQITCLREYRQALITAAVTGQIDVTQETAA